MFDNRSTILITENECSSSAGQSKYIDIRFKFVAQTIAENIVRVRYTPTEEILTATRTYKMNALCACMMLILG